jgi:hypothetical protein
MRLSEVREVLVVHQDRNHMGGPQEIVSPFLQGMDDSEQFTVIDVIVPCCGT